MEILLLIALPFIMAILNRWRGSRMDQLIGSDLWFIKNGAPIAAVGIMLIVAALTQDWIVAFLAGLAYFGGETFGWAKWVRSAQFWWTDWQKQYNRQWLARETGKSSGIHQIANMFAKETEDFTSYAIISLILRGIWWWAPVFAVLAGFGAMHIPVAIIATLAMGIMFPICYYIGGQMHNKNIMKDSIFFGIYMNNAEKIYGFAQGAILALAFLFSQNMQTYFQLSNYYFQ